jgi:steroid delta-isomerase-like uncharacterized protein
MSIDANEAVVRRFWDTVINQRDIGAADEVLAADYIHHDPALPPAMQLGRDAYLQGMSAFHDGFPDLNVTVDDLFGEGDKVVCRWTVRGRQERTFMGIPSSGRTIVVSAISVHRLADGRITESWVNFDALGMMQQLGVVPTPEAAAQ